VPSYTCAHCGTVSDDLTGWSKTVLQPAVYDATAPIVQWVGDVAATEYLFHAEDCRTAWLARVGAPA